MTVTLTNRSGRLFVAVLAHEAFCSAAGECHCAPPPRRGSQRVPSSLSIPTGERLSGLNEAVLLLTEVRTGLRSGALAATRDEPATPALQVTAPAEIAEPTDDSDSQPRRKRGSP